MICSIAGQQKAGNLWLLTLLKHLNNLNVVDKLSPKTIEQLNKVLFFIFQKDFKIWHFIMSLFISASFFLILISFENLNTYFIHWSKQNKTHLISDHERIYVSIF